MILREIAQKWPQSWVCTLLVLFFLQAHADTSSPGQDEVVLKNGSRLIGTVTGSRKGVVTIETDFAGTLEVALDKITSINTREPVVVLLEDETVLRDSPLNINEQELVVVGAEQTYPVENLRIVNPEPWELGQGYRWTGALGFALSSQRGNTDTNELDYKLATVWRSKRDRYSLNANGENDAADGDKTADNWQVTGKYDYFLEDPNYVGLLTFVEKDKFRDLDLRYLIGPYLGRQFYDEPIFSMNGELGFSYVTEEYNVAEDQDYAASNWNLHASSDYLGGDSSLYFDQLGVWNLEDTSDVIVNSTFGLSFPLFWSLEAAAEVLLEYDSGAVDDVDKLDQTYKVRIGYTW
ncbi:MAG: DUF481 domain-containing protein [Halioglobus sp.]